MSYSVDVKIDLTQRIPQWIDVELRWTPINLNQKIIIPAWTPGSYTIRDHSQYISKVKLSQQDVYLNIKRLDTNTWIYKLNQLSQVKLSYSVEAKSLTVRTCYIDNEFCSLALAALIMQVEEHRCSNHNLTLDVPNGWEVNVPLEFKRHYHAANYDKLIDAPIHGGNLETHNIKVRNYRHKIILIGNKPKELPKNFKSDISNICNATCSIMQSDPPSGSSYTFILHILDKGFGGLEHDNSSVLHFNWRDLYKKKGYIRLMQLFGHEYLHQWNVRRLRPREYCTYNYSLPILSDSLWFSEGVTTYFDMALPYLAGLIDQDEYFVLLSENISKVLNTPGRFIQTLSDSSKEAWVKLYKSTKSSKQSQVSYYSLGALCSLLLDIRLRKYNYSLSSLLRKLWEEYGIDKSGFLRSDIMDILAKIDSTLPEDLNCWLDQLFTIPIEKSLDSIGLLLKKDINKDVKYGINLLSIEGRLIIDEIYNNSSAYDSGLLVGDEIIAINGFRLINKEDLHHLLLDSERNNVIYSRRGLIKKMILNINHYRIYDYKLDINQNSSEDQIKLRQDWLKFI